MTVFECSKSVIFQSPYTNLSYLLLSYSRSQNSSQNSYWLLIIVCPKGGSFLFLGCWSSPMFCCFITCMGADFAVIELDKAILFSTLSWMSWFLWHSSKWVYQFGHLLQDMPGPEMLTCSLNTDLNSVTAMLQLRPKSSDNFLGEDAAIF